MKERYCSLHPNDPYGCDICNTGWASDLVDKNENHYYRICTDELTGGNYWYIIGYNKSGNQGVLCKE